MFRYWARAPQGSRAWTSLREVASRDLLIKWGLGRIELQIGEQSVVPNGHIGRYQTTARFKALPDPRLLDEKFPFAPRPQAWGRILLSVPTPFSDLFAMHELSITTVGGYVEIR